MTGAITLNAEGDKSGRLDGLRGGCAGVPVHMIYSKVGWRGRYEANPSYAR